MKETILELTTNELGLANIDTSNIKGYLECIIVEFPEVDNLLALDLDIVILKRKLNIFSMKDIKFNSYFSIRTSPIDSEGDVYLQDLTPRFLLNDKLKVDIQSLPNTTYTIILRWLDG